MPSPATFEMSLLEQLQAFLSASNGKDFQPSRRDPTSHMNSMTRQQGRYGGNPRIICHQCAQPGQQQQQQQQQLSLFSPMAYSCRSSWTWLDWLRFTVLKHSLDVVLVRCGGCALSLLHSKLLHCHVLCLAGHTLLVAPC